MTILLKVYAGWTNADEDVADWAHAFPDSATTEEIARELFNREQANDQYLGWQDHVDVVTWASRSIDFGGAQNNGLFKKLDRPGVQLGGRIVKIGRA